MLNKIIAYFLYNKLVTIFVLALVVLWGISTAPFNWDEGIVPRNPVPVDAIPDLGENQQIVYTEWPGHSPRDVEDQISYPLTTSLLGIPGVKTIRSNSIFGLSSVYLIFEEDREFYWSRSRVLEKLNALPKNLLPDGVTPTLGPDATALGQVYWYTLEGRDPEGKPAGGWDPHELRTIQDFQVKYGLSAVKGVSEVGTIGGFVKEYQVDIDPHAMEAYRITVPQIMQAVKKSNLDIGARTLEYNRVEYLIRGLGYIKDLKDLEESVIVSREDVPIRIKDVAHVSFGPAARRGGLDKGGVEAVGGVVVARYGSNPLQVIQRVKEKIAEIKGSLPTKTLSDGTTSRVTIVPFYDRTGLIKETLGTLEEALSLEVLIALLIVLAMVLNLRASAVIATLLPLGVLFTFIMMRQFGVNANIVSLSGIAIAIGVMIDVGIVFTENIIQHLQLPENRHKRGGALVDVVYRGVKEVAPAVITALMTTVVSFLPVFAMQNKEGKLFTPLAFTKTFAMLAALFAGLIFIPTLAYLVFSIRLNKGKVKVLSNSLLVLLGLGLWVGLGSWVALVLTLFGAHHLLAQFWPKYPKRYTEPIDIGIALFAVVYFITEIWVPLGVQHSFLVNFLFVALTVGSILGVLIPVIRHYPRMLTWCLEHKGAFFVMPMVIILFGLISWLGFTGVFGFLPGFVKGNVVWHTLAKKFPALGNEFMPPLDEGSFLLMPTTMPHAGVAENIDVIQKMDARLSTIPEVEQVVGKWGRVNSALDPAPTSMYENIINYRPEFKVDEDGRKLRFKTNLEGAFELKDGSSYQYGEDPFRTIATGDLIVDDNGKYFRQWREEIHSPNDIWNAIVEKSRIPGTTSAPKLQPIQTRLVMLSTGMRAPMGLKIFGPDLQTIEQVGYKVADLLKQVPGIMPSTVFADRVAGKPYLEIDIDRNAIARYGLTIADVQAVLGVGIGGATLTTTVEGRERFPVRARYAREYRDSPEDLGKVLIPTPNGAQVTLEQLADLRYTIGPQVIKSENTFLVSYVIFDKQAGYAEGDVIEHAQELLKEKTQSGDLVLPAGVSYRFAGSHEDQIRATKRLKIVVPISLFIILLILYVQFRSLITVSFIFSGLAIALAGGFILLWVYNQSGFLNLSILGINLRDLFQIHAINLSVAVWVGFIALLGVATDNGVLMNTYLDQLFAKKSPRTVADVRSTVLEAATKRVRPAVMTMATTIIALIPVLTSRGKGADIMSPMAVPLFGGMLVVGITLFTVPVLYSLWKERKLKHTV